MNQIVRNVTVLNDGYKEPIDYVRFTKSIPIVFNFTDYTIPEGATANAFCVKPSGNAVYNTAEVSGNTVIISVTDQMFIELGKTELQVQIASGTNNLVTFSWPVNVKPNYTEGDIPPSQNESTIFEEIEQSISGANQATSEANQAAESANSAAESANQAAATVQAGFESIKNAVVGEIINDETPSETNTFSSSYVSQNYLTQSGLQELAIAFQEASERENIASGETLSVLFGKISKFFSDLAPVAFSGAYSDLTGAISLINNLDTQTPGQGALDAAQGYALYQDILSIPKIESGNGTVTVQQSSYQTVTVQFQNQYKTPPNVVCCLQGSRFSNIFFVTLASVSTASASIYITNDYTQQSSISYQWIAVGS